MTNRRELEDVTRQIVDSDAYIRQDQPVPKQRQKMKPLIVFSDVTADGFMTGPDKYRWEESLVDKERHAGTL